MKDAKELARELYNDLFYITRPTRGEIEMAEAIILRDRREVIEACINVLKRRYAVEENEIDELGACIASLESLKAEIGGGE